MGTLCGAALLHPLLFAAVAVAMAFSWVDRGGAVHPVAIFAVVAAAPFMATVGGGALWRWCFSDRANGGSIGLLCGVVVMAGEFMSHPFLLLLRHFGSGAGQLSVDQVLLAISSLTVVVVLSVSAVMVAVLAVELPVRIVLSACGSYQSSGTLQLARCVLSFLVLLAGAGLVADSVADQLQAILGSLMR
jgi:hypothetical protein